jgi:membrane-associated protein
MPDIESIIKTGGYLGLSLIVFAESGLLIGFFLPGDSLLFTAGILASQGYLHIGVLIPLLFLAAVVGDNVGYSFGARVGKRIFNRPNSRFFKKDYVERSEKFYADHGPKTIVLARFIPVVRTFAPILAGVAKMNYSTFFTFNIAGGFIWSVGLLLLGYFLGNSIPNINKYIFPILAVIIIASILPGIVHLLKPKSKT